MFKFMIVQINFKIKDIAPEKDNANFFDNPYYQEKLTAKQMLQAAQMEYKEGYKEVWESDKASAMANVSEGSFSGGSDVEPEDRLKYLDE